MSSRSPDPGLVLLGFVVTINYSLAKSHSPACLSLRAPTTRSKFKTERKRSGFSAPSSELSVPRRELWAPASCSESRILRYEQVLRSSARGPGAWV